MTASLDDLPPEIHATLMTFLREVNGEFEVADMQGFLAFIADNMERHPALQGLVQLNEEAVVARFQQSGEVPPGVKLIKKTREEGNVTRLEIFRGPLPPKP